MIERGYNHSLDLNRFWELMTDIPVGWDQGVPQMSLGERAILTISR